MPTPRSVPDRGRQAGSPTTTTCPDASADAGDDADDAEASDASSDQTCTTDAAGGSGGSGGSGGTTTGACGTAVPMRDLVPDPDFTNKYQCGTGTAATTSATIKDLTNWLPTNVAIASVDAAGNAGPLSDVACGTPEPVDGFDEVYRRSGGTAGDGFFCSVHYPRSRPGERPLIAFGLLALAHWVSTPGVARHPARSERAV